MSETFPGQQERLHTWARVLVARMRGSLALARSMNDLSNTDRDECMIEALDTFSQLLDNHRYIFHDAKQYDRYLALRDQGYALTTPFDIEPSLRIACGFIRRTLAALE